MRTKEEVIQEVLLKNQSLQLIKEIDEAYFKNIISEAKNYQLWDDLVHIYCNQANIYLYYLANFKAAKKALNNSKKMFVKGSSNEVIARHYGIWANVYRLEAKFPLAIENASPYGNAASVFTQNGGFARYIIDRASAGMIGVNVGVPVPREPFSFGGWNESKFGVGDITGKSSIEFWTKLKKSTTKWNPEAGVNWMS